MHGPMKVKLNTSRTFTLTETSVNSKDDRSALRCWCLVLSAFVLCLTRLLVINERDITIASPISFQWRGWGASHEVFLHSQITSFLCPGGQ